MATNRPTMFLAALGFILIPACTGEPTALQAEVNDSRGAWADVKVEIGDSYTYLRESTNGESGTLHTTIEVEAGVVVRRTVLHTQWEGEVIEDFTETGADVGTTPGGHEPLTLDALYTLCEDEILPMAGGDITVEFATFEDGVAKRCTALDPLIQDGGPDGFILLSLDYGEPEPCGVGVAADFCG